MELLLAKPGGVELASVWDAFHGGDLGRAADVGRLLGWSENWTRQVVRHALPVLCTWAAKSLDELADDDLSRFIDEVEHAAFLSESARYRVHTRLFARVFCDWLADQHPDVGRLDQLERTTHIEPFIAWSRTRPWRGPNGRGRTISLRQFHHGVDLRVFFEDIAAWGWPSQPGPRLLFLADLPRVPEAMPRALPPVTDSALMGAVRRLEDPLARAPA